jgi:endonuclease III-like uncharacterized protein
VIAEWKKFEKQLEDLKSSTDDGDIIKGKILELENLIKKYYTQKAEAAKIRSRIKVLNAFVNSSLVIVLKFIAQIPGPLSMSSNFNLVDTKS